MSVDIYMTKFDISNILKESFYFYSQYKQRSLKFMELHYFYGYVKFNVPKF